jgi:hypothetical protein
MRVRADSEKKIRQNKIERKFARNRFGLTHENNVRWRYGLVVETTWEWNVTVYAGRAGDRNPRAMQGAVSLGTEIARRYAGSTYLVGTAAPIVNGGWVLQLREAMPDLRLLADDLAKRLDSGNPAITVVGRCAAAIATLPVVARRHPKTAIVYFDAHGDCNTPQDKPFLDSAYLGGMVLSGAAGEWDTGLGMYLDLSQVVLAGSRDLDPPEREKIETGRIRLVEMGPCFVDRLLAAIGERSVYIHLDCDVLEAGLVPTEYQVPNGLSYAALEEACTALSKLTVIGLEIAEYEWTWPDGKPANPDRLISAIDPILKAIR